MKKRGLQKRVRMMTGYSVMITPENVMMRTRFLGAMEMFYFRTIERRGNRW